MRGITFKWNWWTRRRCSWDVGVSLRRPCLCLQSRIRSRSLHTYAAAHCCGCSPPASYFVSLYCWFPSQHKVYSYIRDRYQHYRVVLVFQYSMEGCRTKPTRAWTSERSTETDEHNSGTRILPCHYYCVEWKWLKMTAQRPERIVYSCLM